MEIDPDIPDKYSESAPDTKSKGKGKFYVGSQDLGIRRDHMQVSLFRSTHSLKIWSLLYVLVC